MRALISTICYLDVDECLRRGICQNGFCVNEVGGYRCECATGYEPSSDKKRCLGEYNSILVDIPYQSFFDHS